VCHPKARCCFSRNLHPAVFCSFLLVGPSSLPHVVGSPSVALHEALQFDRDGVSSCAPWALPDEEGMARETRALPGRRQRGLGAAKAGSGKSIQTVSHRPLPGLPDEEGIARETRALPGRRQRGLGGAKAGSGKSVGTVSHRPLPGLPDEEGMARETRALPGRRQRGLGGSFDQK